MSEKLAPGPVQVDLWENVALGDVAAALPHDVLVTVASRATVHEEGPRHIDDVEHVVIIPEEAYKHLASLGRLERRRRRPEPEWPGGVRPADLGRRAAVWAERAARFERHVAEAAERGADSAAERRLGVLCRQAAAEFDGLRQRVEGAE